MNLLTEYASRPGVAICLLNLPCSIIAIDSSSNPRVLKISNIDGKEVSLELYGGGNKDTPNLITEEKIFQKYLFDPKALSNIFTGCKMMPYFYEKYPIGEINNDPPYNQEQEVLAGTYFKTLHNCKMHQEYRRTIVWWGFIKDNIFIDSYNKLDNLPKLKRATDGCKFIEPQNVKMYDKETWSKWISWCDKLLLKNSSNWASELLFANTLPRMNKKEMNSVSIPWSEDAEAA